MKQILLTFCFCLMFWQTFSQSLSFDPNEVFAKCPNEWINYTVTNTSTAACSYDWTVTNGEIQGGFLNGNVSTFTGGTLIQIKWFDTTNSGSVKAVANCNPSSGNGQRTISIPILSINGVNPGTITGASTVTVNVTTNQSYSIPQINFPNIGSGDVNPKQVNGYEWEIPSGWTVISGGNTKSITVKPDNCSGGNIRVRGKNTLCSAGTFYTNWSTVKTVTRNIATPGAISGPDQLNCSDITVRTYSISAVTGAQSYTWTLPSGWSGSSTTTSINVTPNGLNGGAITVKANGCSIQSSAASKTITLNLTDPNNQPSISGSSPVCYVSQPLSGTDFTLSNLPQNSTVSWTTSSTLTVVSGQGTTTLRVKASSSSTSDRGWVEALITTPCGSPPPIRYNVWAGKPYDFLVNGPTLVQAGSFNFYEMKKWGWPTNNSYASFTEQGIAPSGFTWSFGWPPTSAGWNCGGCVGEYNTIQAGSQSTYVTAHVQNTCGTTTRNYEVFVQQQDCPPGGCEEPFFVYPNPSSEELTVSTNLTDEEAMSEVTLVDSQGTVVYTTKTKAKEQIKIPVREFKNGLYYLKVNQNGVSKQRQIIINH